MTDYEALYAEQAAVCGAPFSEYVQFFNDQAPGKRVLDLGCGQGRDALSAAPGIKFMDESETAGYPTPVGDAVGSDMVFVGRLRQHPDYPERFSFWVTVDNLRKGSALNAIQIAEILVKDYI